MGSGTEPAKALLPYLQRADELQKHEPLVAYYCRLYAMEKGLAIPQKDRTKTTNTILVSLMNQLEKDKKSLTLVPDDNLHLEGFALNVFAKADKQDRAGRADINTAKTFYAASIFFEILNQFGELQPDLEQKQKYAIWKAAEIRKAFKEGRKPEAGPPGGDEDEAPTSTTTTPHDTGRSQSFNSRQYSDGTSSQPGDKDLSRRESFSAAHPGSNMPQQNTEKFNDHVPTQSPYSLPSQSQYSPPSQSSYSSPAYQGIDYPSTDTQKPPSNYSSSPYASTDYPSNDVHKPPSNYSPPYTRTGYPLNDAHKTQSNDEPDISGYPHSYHQPPYTIEQQHVSQNYYSTENPTVPYSYPNFQSYPSFHDSPLPTVPTHQSSFYAGADGTPAASYSASLDSTLNHPVSTQYHHSGADATHQVTPPASPASLYKYDSSYQPAVEKIAEAHKAARFAVGALAFDDVSVAVDHLKRALDLLTNPSAETH